MSKRNKGWKVIKTLNADEVKAIRETELRGAAQSHAAAGEQGWANEYDRRAAQLGCK